MSRAPHNIPIWARPEPGARRPRFTREQIAATALALADAEGFEAVSMRRLAAELGAGTMTLYHYVQTKDDLIDLLDNALIAEILVPEGELPDDWRGALTVIARRTRAAYLRHPWALHALQGALIGPNGLRHIDQTLAAVEHTALDEAGKFELLALVDDFVFGHALRFAEVRSINLPDSQAIDAMVAWTQSELSSGRYPHLQAAGDPPTRDSWAEIAGRITDDDRFERGLQALLDGAAMLFGLPSS